MEPVTLITTAIALATPYLLKTGESIAEGIGEDIWKLIKKPFTKDKEDQLSMMSGTLAAPFGPAVVSAICSSWKKT